MSINVCQCKSIVNINVAAFHRNKKAINFETAQMMSQGHNIIV